MGPHTFYFTTFLNLKQITPINISVRMKNLTAFFWIEGCPAFYLWKVIIKYLFSLREPPLSTINAHGPSGKARKYLEKTHCTRFSSRWICVKFLELYNDRCRIFLCIDHCKNHEKRTKIRWDKSGTLRFSKYVGFSMRHISDCN